MGPLLATLLLAIEIHAAGDCPGAAEVERQLGPLLGEATTVGMQDVATIKRGRDGSVSVSLADTSGRAIGDRRLPRARSCGDQAESIAVTLAIWEAQLHPEISLRLDRLAAESAPPAPPPPAAPLDPTPEVVVARPSPPPQRRVAKAVAVAAMGDWQSSSWSPGGRVELGLGPAEGRWRLRVAGVGVGTHTVAVPPGEATWWRAFVSLRAEVDVARGRSWAVAVGGGPAGGVASISGARFDVNRHTRSLDVGGELGVRLEWRPGRLRPWLGGSVVGWARRQALDLEGTSTGVSLPRVEPLATLGADFVW
jgi:hypothetical protein